MDIERILKSLDQYDDGCNLECDGLTRVLSYVLTINHVEHEVEVGTIQDTVTAKGFKPHFWIDLPDGRRIDYRARMWLGENNRIPHGVFNPDEYSDVRYDGDVCVFENLNPTAVFLLTHLCGEHLL